MTDADKLKAAWSKLKFDKPKGEPAVFYRGKWMPASKAAKLMAKKKR